MTAWADGVAVGLAALIVAVALIAVPDTPRTPASPVGGTSGRPTAVATVVPSVVPTVVPARYGFAVPMGVFLVGSLVAPSLLWLWVAVGVVLAVGRGRWAARGSPRRRVERRRLLIVHAELLASSLESGLTMSAALGAVGDVMDRGRSASGTRDPLAALDSVAAMLALGADADTAWRAVDADDDLAPLAAAGRRSASGGTTLADAVREHGRQLRDEARQEAGRSAGRAGVAMTAPLGVCFLPAFICLGLAPVVLGLLNQLSIR